MILTSNTMVKFNQILQFQNISKNYWFPVHHSRVFKINFSSSIRKNLLGNKTHGASSSATNLKEALCEKIPIYYDLLREFRREHGDTIVSKITVNDMYRGLLGVNMTVKETSETHSRLGILYRGLTMSEVIELLPRRGYFPMPESIFWLLLTGDIPTQVQTTSLISDWVNRREKQKILFNEPQNFLQALAKKVGPITKLSIVLATFDSSDKHVNTQTKSSVTSFMDWEEIYEHSMDILAIFPAILALVRSPQHFKQPIHNREDWVDFLCNILNDSGEKVIIEESSAKDFLKLIIALNADEDGGVPSSHICQILGSCQSDPKKALAASFLALANEPVSGNLTQCMNFLERVQRLLGDHRKEDVLKGIVGAFTRNPKSFTGYSLSDFHDPRYNILCEFVRRISGSSLHPDIKLALDISNMVETISRSRVVRLRPNINSLAAPLFKCHGLYDMEFNQAIICMSRAMGLLASIIWSRIINLPMENPSSRSTHSYIEIIKEKH